MDYLPINKNDNPNDIQKSHNEGCIAQMSDTALEATLTHFEQKWKLNTDDVVDHFQEKFVNQMFHVSSISDLDKDKINATLVPPLEFLVQMHNRCVSGKFFDSDPREIGASLGIRINRAIKMLSFWKLALMNQKHMLDVGKQGGAYMEIEFDSNNIMAPTIYDPSRDEGNNDYQMCIIYILEMLKDSGFKRYKGWVCDQIGITKAWKKYMTVEDYIETIFQKELNFEMWRRFTKSGNTRKNLVEHLKCCVDPMFPELQKNRHVFSFKDGIFVAKDDSQDGWWKFYPYDSQDFKKLPANLVSAKYFDMDFGAREYKDWREIKTTSLDTILDYQKFDEEVKRWMYIFIGRMVFDVNEMDKWQVVPFHKGMASTGKGKLCEICAHFYEGEDVGQMSDLPEKNFALSAIFNKFMFVAPEITEKFGLGQAEFQSMVSGELVSVAQKFKTAQAIEWKTPGMFAGNEPPGYRDNSGSIQRRMIIFPFRKQVLPEHMDMELPEKLKAETARILFKCVWAYQEAAREHKKAGIWSVLPATLQKAKEEMALSTNALRHFMASEVMDYGEDKEIPLNLFIRQFNEHCRANNLGRYKFGPDFYNGPFGSKNVDVVSKTAEYKGKVYKRHNWVVGVDIIDDDDDFAFSNDH
jgi:hypothetical protein